MNNPHHSQRRSPFLIGGVVLVIFIIIFLVYYYYYSPSTAVTPVILTANGIDYAAVPLSCPSGKITVASAQYASTVPGKCAGANNLSSVAALCNGNPSCMINVLPSSMKMKNGQMGSLLTPDPCPGIGKTLNVGYSCA